MTDLTDLLAAREPGCHPSDERVPIAEVERILLERIEFMKRDGSAPGVEEPLADAEAPSPPPPRLVAPGWTPARQRAFIDHLSTSGCVAHAARAVGLSKQSAYRLRDRTPNSIFTLAWDVAIARSRRLILDRATEVALEGREVPVLYRGQEVGTRTVHSDQLMMFLLRLKREPSHPNLSEHELAELWPAMLEQIDVLLPPVLTPDRLAELGVDDR